MGFFAKILSLLVVLGSVFLYIKLNKSVPVPTLEEDIWWGIGSPQKEDPRIRPFKISVPDDVIRDLKDRLNRTLPFHPPLEGVNQNYGLNTELLQTIVDYWKNEYDWKKREQFLNQFPQYKTNIQGLDIHFIHVKPQNVPKGVEVLPIILLHGWPGSVREFYEMIPLLTTPRKDRDFVFEVVVPSLPGYGFSGASVRPGMTTTRMAQIFNKLMLRLKLDRYYAQGGDWGSAIAKDLGIFYPGNVIGVHRNMCAGDLFFNPKTYIGMLFPALFFTEKEAEMLYPFNKVFNYIMLESGYMHLQATKPDTVAVALRESPAGLAAYLIEKFITWTNPAWKDLPDGGLSKKYTMDQLLDNVMIYWVTRSITTSMRLYSENFNRNYQNKGFDKLPIHVPTGCSRFEHEIIFVPESIIREDSKNLIYLKDHEDGGHFAALELTEVLAKDVIDFVVNVRNLPKLTL